VSKAKDEIWQEGFSTGERLVGGCCPYACGSPEAEAWEDGWTQGVLKREGLDYRDEPGPSGWEQLIRRSRRH
jgi:hypothetical protein